MRLDIRIVGTSIEDFTTELLSLVEELKSSPETNCGGHPVDYVFIETDDLYAEGDFNIPSHKELYNKLGINHD